MLVGRNHLVLERRYLLVVGMLGTLERTDLP
jgi:hypothetical protein